MNLVPRKYYLDSIFDNFFTEGKSNMKCDIYEEEGKYHIELDLPGFNKDDIKLECHDGYLTIMAEKENESEKNEKNYIKKERIYGKIERQFYIGDVLTENIEASMNDGILKIVVPKEETVSSKKQIEIK